MYIIQTYLKKQLKLNVWLFRIYSKLIKYFETVTVLLISTLY